MSSGKSSVDSFCFIRLTMCILDARTFVLMDTGILSRIFANLERSDHARNMPVCSTWNLVAYPLVWKGADPRIFQTLAESHISSDGLIVCIVLALQHSDLRLTTHV